MTLLYLDQIHIHRLIMENSSGILLGLPYCHLALASAWLRIQILTGTSFSYDELFVFTIIAAHRDYVLLPSLVDKLVDL